MGWQALARADPGADRVPRRGQRAQPRLVIPARGVVKEVQVDDQPPVPPAEIGALGGIEHVPAAAVTRLTRGAIAQRQEQAAGVLLQPPHVDRRIHRRRQVHAAQPGHRGQALAGRHGYRHVPVSLKQWHVETQARIVGPVRQARPAQRVAGPQRALRVRPEQLIAAVPPPFMPALRTVLGADRRVQLTDPAPPVGQLEFGAHRGAAGSGPRGHKRVVMSSTVHGVTAGSVQH